MTHYYDKKQSSPMIQKSINVNLLGNSLRLIAASGVFSKRRIDRGSEILIENAKIKDGEKILDVGCGYGAIGISLAKRYAASVVMVDVNERAVMLAAKNARNNGVNADIFQSDLYSNVEGEFDVVLSNPPQSAGKKVCFALIDGAYDLLKEEGSLQIVARNQKGGKDLKKRMLERFGNSETIARESGYHIYLSVKTTKDI